MIDVRCGDSVECGDSCGGAVVCTMIVTGREYARLKAIADTLNALAGETPSYGCEADNTPASVFAGFFVTSVADIGDEHYRFVSYDLANAGWDDAKEIDAVAERLADALKRVDETFAKSE